MRMYSSFKKHQLITESWRRFINEASKEEIQHFGNWIDEEYLDKLSQEVSNAWNDVRTMDNPNFQQFGEGKLEFLDNGSFRAAYAPPGDKDFIVKFAFEVEGKAMNQREFELQKDLSELFPKVFKHADDFSWIVAERISVIEERKDFIEYFNPLSQMFKELGYGLSDYYTNLINVFFDPKEPDIKYEQITQNILGDNRQQSKYNKSKTYFNNIFVPVINMIQPSDFKGSSKEVEEAKIDLEELKLEPQVYTNLENAIYSFEKVGVNLVLLLSKRLVEYVNNTPFLNKVKDVIKRYDIIPREIRVRNTGVNTKKEFRIIDASVRSDINPFINQPLNPTRSKPADKTLDLFE